MYPQKKKEVSGDNQNMWLVLSHIKTQQHLFVFSRSTWNPVGTADVYVKYMEKGVVWTKSQVDYLFAGTFVEITILPFKLSSKPPDITLHPFCHKNLID